MTDGAEIEGIVEPQPLDPVLRHHHTHIDVALAAPVEFVPLEAKAMRARRRLHRGDPLGHHLATDAVAGNHRDPIILCHPEPPNAAAPPSSAQMLRSLGILSNAKPHSPGAA